MTYKLPYEKFHTKLKDLWESCGDQFPPRIIEDTFVYLNGKTSSIILNAKKNEYLEVETENDEAKKTIESGNYMITYGIWFDDDHFSYIMLPMDNHMKSLDLVSQRIPRMNIKSLLPRLGVYGLDYAIHDLAHNTEIIHKLYLYKDHTISTTNGSSEVSNSIPTDYSKRIGYIISIIALLGYKATTLTSIVIPIAILAIPIFDTAFAILRRLLKHKNPFTNPDREHLHHQLLKMKFSPRTTILIIYSITILFSVVSVLFVLHNQKVSMIIYAVLMIILLIIVMKTDILFEHKKKEK